MSQTQADLRRRAKSVFLEAVEAPARERPIVVTRACGSDAALLAEVERLLAAHERAETAELTRSETASQVGDDTGRSFGPYRLLRRIGEGGFGVVYLAEQTEPVRREVALKVVKLGMDTRQVIARFGQERAALAVMDHPGIARVLDAGATPEGRPYFVMELVRGVPIHEYCDTHSLGIRERIGLFIAVCRGVQHAHQKGIIHRDLKPTNVLVCDTDAGPAPKIIDFGIAKATAPVEGAVTTTLTGQRAIIGTPEYMSPEQLSQGTTDIDTRSDIYALGVMLYELLAGARPFDSKRLRSAELADLKRIIREEDPPPPSARVQAMAPQARADVAHRRRVEGAGLARVLRGDLDWIIGRAMEKNPGRRYESAAGLALDLERHLEGMPVQAAPPGTLYRWVKVVRRHRVAFGAGTMTAAALIVGLGLALLGLARATSERDQKELARAAEARARASSDEHAARALRQAYRATISAASAAADAGEYANAVRDLDLAPPSLRGWEWRHVRFNAERDVRVMEFPRTGIMYIGERFMALDRYERKAFELYEWETGTGYPFSAQGLEGVMSLALNSTQDRVLVCQYYGSMLLEFPSMRLVRRLGSEERFETQPFAPDGAQFVTAEMNSPTLKIHESATGTLVRELDMMSVRRRRSFAAYAPDGVHVAVEARDGFTSLVDATTGATVWEAVGVMPRFTPDGRRVLVIEGTPSGTPILAAHAIADGARVGAIDLTGMPVDVNGAISQYISVHPQGDRIAVQRLNGDVRLYDGKTLLPLGHLPTPGMSGGVAYSGDGAHLAVASRAGQLRVFDSAATPSPWQVAADQTATTRCASVSPDGATVCTADWGRVMAWDALTGEVKWVKHHSVEFASAAAFSPDGALIAITGDRGSVRIMDAATGELRSCTLPRGFQAFGADAIKCAGWTPRGDSLLVGTGDGAILRLDREGALVGPEIDVRPDHAGQLAAVGDKVFAALSNGEIGAWELERGSNLWKRALAGASCVAVGSANGLVAAGGAASLLVVDQRDGTVKLDIAIDGDQSSMLAFHPDGSRIAAGRSSGQVALFDMASGDRVATLETRSATRCLALAFDPSGNDLVASTIGYSVIRFATADAAGPVLAKRELARLARAEVDRARTESFYVQEAVRLIASDQQTSERVRGAALAMAMTLGDHAAICNNSAVLCGSRRAPSDLPRAARESELAVALTNDPYVLNVRGLVLYRLGRYAESLEFLDRAQKEYAKQRPNWGEGMPLLVGPRTLALARVGKMEEARESFVVLSRLLKNPKMAGDFDLDLGAEAAELLGVAAPEGPPAGPP